MLRLLAVGAAAVGAVLGLLPAGGHDQLWCLYAAGRVLDGVRLYGPELFESNPPLIVWMSAVPVALARLLRVEPSLIAKLLVLAALGGVFALSLRCLRSAVRRFPMDAELLALFFAVAYLCVPARDFGQREHLLSFLVLPYLLLCAATCATRGNTQAHSLTATRIDPGTHGETATEASSAAIGTSRASVPSTLHVLAGLLAATGICLKPQQALVPLCVEAALLLHSRSWRTLRRPEPWLLLTVCLGYIGLMHLATPDYFSLVLPVLRETYWAIGHLSFPALLGESVQMQVLFLSALAFFAYSRNTLAPAARTLAIALLAAAAGSNAAYLQQGTGWYYQQLPGIVFSLAALFVLAASALSRRTLRLPRAAVPATAFLAILAPLLTLHFSGYPITTDRAFALTTPDPGLFRNLPPNTPIATLTTSVDEAIMPVARYHLLWAQRTNNLWWMPAILRAEASEPRALRKLSPPQLQQLAAAQRANMAADLNRWQPTLVLVERCQDPAVRCQVIEDLSPNLLAWFQQSPAFRTAFAPYARTGTSGRFDVYRRAR